MVVVLEHTRTGKYHNKKKLIHFFRSNSAHFLFATKYSERKRLDFVSFSQNLLSVILVCSSSRKTDKKALMTKKVAMKRKKEKSLSHQIKRRHKKVKGKSGDCRRRRETSWITSNHTQRTVRDHKAPSRLRRRKTVAEEKCPGIGQSCKVQQQRQRHSIDCRIPIFIGRFSK